MVDRVIVFYRQSYRLLPPVFPPLTDRVIAFYCLSERHILRFFILALFVTLYETAHLLSDPFGLKFGYNFGIFCVII